MNWPELTAEQWAECTRPSPMINHLEQFAAPSERRSRLFGCACLRNIWQALDRRCREAVEVAERFADGQADVDQLAAALTALHTHDGRRTSRAAYTACGHVAFDDEASARVGPRVSNHRIVYSWYHAGLVCGQASNAAQHDAFHRARRATLNGNEASHRALQAVHQAQIALLRDVCGDPFRPPTLDPACLTTTVSALAQAAYENRFRPSGHLYPSRLGVLSDALEEAGCTDQVLLSHLRSPGPHVRGCHILDLILGKS
jgi:hypothetical protein